MPSFPGSGEAEHLASASAAPGATPSSFLAAAQAPQPPRAWGGHSVLSLQRTASPPQPQQHLGTPGRDTRTRCLCLLRGMLCFSRSGLPPDCVRGVTLQRDACAPRFPRDLGSAVGQPCGGGGRGEEGTGWVSRLVPLPRAPGSAWVCPGSSPHSLRAPSPPHPLTTTTPPPAHPPTPPRAHSKFL